MKASRLTPDKDSHKKLEEIVGVVLLFSLKLKTEKCYSYFSILYFSHVSFILILGRAEIRKLSKVVFQWFVSIE